MMATQISHELQISRYAGGVKLTRPDSSRSGQFVGDFMKKKYNVYFLDAAHRIQAINEPSLQSCGFNSARDAIGSTMEKVVLYSPHLQLLYNHEEQVMRAHQRFVFAQYGELVNGNNINAVSTLWPWYDDEDEIIGTFGCSVLLQNKNLQEIADHLKDIQHLFLPDIPAEVMAGTNFSRREMDVIRLIMRGKTMREIAVQLGLSPRTVESYFVTIKIKANVANKSELIGKYYEYF